MNPSIFENPTHPLAKVESPAPSRSHREVISRPPPRPEVKTNKTPFAYLRALIFLLIGAACGYSGMLFGQELFVSIPGTNWLLLLTLCGLPLVWLMSVGIHELGHVIGGWLGGGKFLLWLAGPVMVRRTPAGIRVSRNRSVNLGGGLSACFPLNPAFVTPRRTALMILSGPLASLLLTTGSLWLAVWLATWDHPISLVGAISQNLMIFNALVSFLIFLVTMVPSAGSGFKSDGKRVLELMRGDARSEQEAALLVLTSANLAGTRPADYNPTLVAKAIALKDGSLFDLYGHLTAYYHAADRGGWRLAQAHLDHALEGIAKMTPFVIDILRCEYAWLLATQTGDAADARAWLDSAGKLDFDPATRLRAEAAVLLAEDKVGEAAAKARAGLLALRARSLSPTENRFASDALELIIKRAEG
jgi:hypothetical protein